MATEYFISTGSKSGFYTLWIETVKYSGGATVNGVYNGQTYKRPEYICNLPRDKERAMKKAREIAGENAHIEFSNFSLDEIRRWKAEEYAKRRKAEADRVAKIDWGVFQAGKYAGRSLAEVMNEDPDYVQFLYDNQLNNLKYQYTLELAKPMLDARMEQLHEKREAEEAERLAKMSTLSYVGEVGERQAFECTVTFSRWFEGNFGDWQLVKMVDAAGNTIVYKGSADMGEKGDKVSFCASVKDHSEYNDEKQTAIKRPTKIQINKEN